MEDLGKEGAEEDGLRWEEVEEDDLEWEEVGLGAEVLAEDDLVGLEWEGTEEEEEGAHLAELEEVCLVEEETAREDVILGEEGADLEWEEEGFGLEEDDDEEDDLAFSGFREEEEEEAIGAEGGE